MENRIITPDFKDEDIEVEKSLRPTRLFEYIGQEKKKKKFSYMVLQGLVKRRCRVLYPMKWVLI